MEQEIRFCQVDGRRIGYATVGAGPLLVFAPQWLSHIEEEWQDRRARAFYEGLAADHQVVRFDHLGAGISDRSPVVPTPESEARTLAAVVEACGGGPAILFARSCSSAAAARYAYDAPDRVAKLVFFDSYACRDDVSAPTRSALVDFVRANWPLAAQMLSGLFLPQATRSEVDGFSRYQLVGAEAGVAAAYLEFALTYDIRPLLSALTMPTLVLHRRGGRAIPIGRGRELAEHLPNARFVPLRGDAHLPWFGDQRELKRALTGFLIDAQAEEAPPESPLTRREREVLRLVAAGLSNREVSEVLVLSPHTVHRHMANILRKLGESSRAAAAARAARIGIV